MWETIRHVMANATDVFGEKTVDVQNGMVTRIIKSLRLFKGVKLYD